MDNNKIQLIGSPCGHHGPYTFYKAFKYHKNGRNKILSLSDFFFVKLWSDSDLMSIGELLLLWADKNSEQVLASLRLYFLPENTPEGRNDDHGEDEVLAISEKVVLRADDLLGWITEEVRWPRGLRAVWDRDCATAAAPAPAAPLAAAPAPPADGPDRSSPSPGPSPGPSPSAGAGAATAAGPAAASTATTGSFGLSSSLLVDSQLDLQDVNKEKSLLGEPDPDENGVVVLSFARYCRYRGIMKRLEGVSSQWLRNALVLALGGFAAPHRNTRVLFCKDTFDYPDLEGHEQLCNHLAPNLKGRPRKRPKKRSLSPGGSESNESESSLSTVSSSLRSKQPTISRNGLRCNSIGQQNSPARGRKTEREIGPDEKEFMVKLHSFMKSRRTPISRVPHLGFKEIDLFAFYNKVQKLGGYNIVTANRQWKIIYDELGGHQGSTSAATYTRRHYERLLLPFEKNIRGDHKVSRSKTKLKIIKAEDKSTDEEKDDQESGGDSPLEIGKVANRSPAKDKLSGESKTAALRSIRTKIDKIPEEKAPADKENIPTTNSVSQVTTKSTCKAFPNGEKNNSPSNLVNGSLGKTDSVVNALTNGEISSSTNPAAETTDSNEKSTSDVKVEPEVIDLASEESQVKVGKTTVPAFKKRKLEILKEGGLEVTAISSLGSETSVSPVAEKRPSVIQHAAPPTTTATSNNQVSITVTPDLSHIIGAGDAPTPSPLLPHDTSVNNASVMNLQDLKQRMQNPTLPQDGSTTTTTTWARRLPPRVVQSRSIYSHSESTVYGNPKDILDPRQFLYPERAFAHMLSHTEEEVLDLRVKVPPNSSSSVNRVHPVLGSMDAPRNLSRNHSKNNSSAIPIIGGRAIVGSNLEITVVDVPKTSSSGHTKVNPTNSHKSHQPQSRKNSGNKTTHRLPPRNENGKFMSTTNPLPSSAHRSTSSSSAGASLIIPNPYLSSACGRSTPSSRTRVSQSQSTVPTSSPSGMLPSFLPGNASLFPGFLPPVSSASNGGKNSNPFLALSDPLYYSSLYASHGLYPPSLSPGFVSPLVTPPMFPPSAEQIQLYKELMSQHHNSLRLAQQGASSFLGLPRDGSTSITPVGPTTNPTSK